MWILQKKKNIIKCAIGMCSDEFWFSQFGKLLVYVLVDLLKLQL